MSPEVVLLTTFEVAAVLRVEATTVRRWVSEGKIPAVTLPGGNYRFYQSDIDEILVARRTESAA